MCCSYRSRARLTSLASCSAGQTGPISRWFEDPNAPERKNADTIGRALFDGESFESWGDLYKINTFSVFFVTTAFLGLLALGTEESPSYTAAVINVTSVSGLMKLSQNHVRPTRSCVHTRRTHTPWARACRVFALLTSGPRLVAALCAVCVQQCQSGRVTPHEDARHRVRAEEGARAGLRGRAGRVGVRDDVRQHHGRPRGQGQQGGRARPNQAIRKVRVCHATFAGAC